MVKSNAPASRISQSIRDGAKNTPNSLLLQILAVVIIGLLVIIVARVIPSSRHSNLPVVSPQSFVDPLVGKEGRTSTDVNIRSGSGAEQQKIGLLEKDSRVRILSYSADRTWYEVQVLKHGRPKTDPNSLDHGWVRSKFIMSAN
jgi:hypothetical protein